MKTVLKLFSRALCVTLAVILTISLCACGGEEASSGASSSAKKSKVSATKVSNSVSVSSNQEQSVSTSQTENVSSSVSASEKESSSNSSASQSNSTSSSSPASLESSTNDSSQGSGPSTPIVNITTRYHGAISGSGSQKIVGTVFETNETVVVDKIVTDYGADPSGANDSTVAIQSAINAVADLGGGTLYFPYGKYLVRGTINVPMYVTLKGDWQNPDSENLQYGTIILAEPSVLGSSNPQDIPLFSLNGNTGIDGFTFYYPQQSIGSIKRYGYTIYANEPVTTTIKNVTFINSCYGVGVSLKNKYNELVNIENFYGTFLYNAISHNATTDVGFYDNINISYKYWVEAGEDFACRSESLLKSHINANLDAIVLGDLDDQLISNVTIDQAKRGMVFTRGIREDAGFWGLVNNAQISAQTGVYADYLNSRSGVVFTASNVGSIVNESPVGVIKLSDTTAELSGSGTTFTESGTADLSDYELRLNNQFNVSTNLYIADGLTSGGKEDNSTKLNEILSNVSSAGGIVVIPNGVYRLNSTVNIPANVELRSTQGVFTRTNQSQNGKNGVVFVSYVSGVTFKLASGAGIRGVRIWHAKNDFLSAQSAISSSSYSYDTSVKAEGNDCYATQIETVGAYYGFDFKSCNNHILKSNYGLSYIRFIQAGGLNGTISSCLANPNFMTRSNLYNYFDSSVSSVANWERIRQSGESNEDFAILRDLIGREHTTMVYLDHANGEKVLNTFCYGESCLFTIYESQNVLLVNTSLDYIPNDKYVYKMLSGSCTIVGSLRVYGISIGYWGGTVKAYGRIAFGVNKEKVYDSTVSTEDKIEYVSSSARRMVLFDCDTIPSGANVPKLTKTDVKQGSACWTISNSSYTSANASATFSAIDVSSFSKGYLHLYIYCGNLSAMGVGQIEITSSGTCDKNELNWSINQVITKTGWNDVYLPINSGGTTGGSIDLTKVNYFRIYVTDTTSLYMIDYVEFVTD